MIELKEVTKKFGTNTALNGISVSIRPGEIVGFLGPNGAGKTTAMRIITGFIAPTSGEVFIDDRPLQENPIRNKRKLGYLPEHNPLYPDLLVSEYLEYMAAVRLIPRRDTRSCISKTVRTCALEQVIDQSISTLSKGYRQRVGLAQALLHNPDILILDEPTSGLDPNQIVEIRNLIKEIGKEKTVILSTHILPEVSAVCDRAIIMNKGHIASQGSIKELEHQAHGQRKVELSILPKKGYDFAEDLKKIDGVKAISTINAENEAEESYLIQSDKDVRADVFKLAVSKSIILVRLAEKTISLEEVFRELTLNES